MWGAWAGGSRLLTLNLWVLKGFFPATDQNQPATQPITQTHPTAAGLYAVAVQHLSDWLLQAAPGALLLALAPPRGQPPLDDPIRESSHATAPFAKRRHHATVLLGTVAAVRREAEVMRGLGREVCVMPRAGD